MMKTEVDSKVTYQSLGHGTQETQENLWCIDERYDGEGSVAYTDVCHSQSETGSCISNP